MLLSYNVLIFRAFFSEFYVFLDRTIKSYLKNEATAAEIHQFLIIQFACSGSVLTVLFASEEKSQLGNVTKAKITN